MVAIYRIISTRVRRIVLDDALDRDSPARSNPYAKVVSVLTNIGEDGYEALDYSIPVDSLGHDGLSRFAPWIDAAILTLPTYLMCKKSKYHPI